MKNQENQTIPKLFKSDCGPESQGKKSTLSSRSCRIAVLCLIVIHNSWSPSVMGFEPAPPLDWAFRIGAGGEDFASNMALDSHGNVYVAGSFTGQVDFDPGVGALS